VRYERLERKLEVKKRKRKEKKLSLPAMRSSQSTSTSTTVKMGLMLVVVMLFVLTSTPSAASDASESYDLVGDVASDTINIYVNSNVGNDSFYNCGLNNSTIPCASLAGAVATANNLVSESYMNLAMAIA